MSHSTYASGTAMYIALPHGCNKPAAYLTTTPLAQPCTYSFAARLQQTCCLLDQHLLVCPVTLCLWRQLRRTATITLLPSDARLLMRPDLAHLATAPSGES